MTEAVTNNPPSDVPTDNVETKWGRVLIAGGTDWPRLGRKDKAPNDDAPDLASPHILRSLGAIKAVAVHGGPAACHFVVRALDGSAFLFGRNNAGALGTVAVRTSKAKGFAKKGQIKEDTPVADDSISENAPRRVKAAALPGGRPGDSIVHAACGRSHTLLVGSNGQVWASGLNTSGQCGIPESPDTKGWQRVQGPWQDHEKAIQVAAGITFSLILTDAGQVYACGSGEHGQLGIGRTGEHIIAAGKTGFDIKDSPVPVRGMEGKKIVQIATGHQHALALSDTGLVYVWGFNGYGRLGLGHGNGATQDALIPKLHPNFAGPNEATMGAQICAGPTSSVVIDRQGMYWLAGKWKNTGDGSGGQPWSSFRYVPDIMTCKMTHASCGGVTLFAISVDDGTIGWGQGASNSELGLGEDQPKSATKPLQVEPLVGIDVFDIAGGQNTTLFLATPTGEKFSDLERHPAEFETPDDCMSCGQKDEGDEANPVLACEKCDEPYHLRCLEPALDAVPEGEWFCPRCEADPLWVIGTQRPEFRTAGGGKRKAPPSQGKAADAKRKK